MNRILRDLSSLKDQALYSLQLMSQGKVLKDVDGPDAMEPDQSSGKENVANDSFAEDLVQPQCDLQVGAFLYTELKKMTKNMLWKHCFFLVHLQVWACPHFPNEWIIIKNHYEKMKSMNMYLINLSKSL